MISSHKSDSFSEILPGKIKWKYEESLCKEACNEVKPELDEEQADLILADLKAYLFLYLPAKSVDFDPANVSYSSTETCESFTTVIEKPIIGVYTGAIDLKTTSESSITKPECPCTSNLSAREAISYASIKKTPLIIEKESDLHNDLTLDKTKDLKKIKNEKNFDSPKIIQLKTEKKEVQNRYLNLEMLNSRLSVKKQKSDVYMRAMVMDLILFSILNKSI